MALVNDIMDYESGNLDKESTIALFQDLINSGLAWSLQGHYGRTAEALIDAGYCQPATKREKQNAV
jgi:hypothetical protein